MSTVEGVEAVAGSAARLRAALGVEQPVLLAGMGGVAGPELAAAVCRAGGLGVIGGYKAVGPALGGMLQELLDTTEGPVSVNVIPEAAGAALLDAQIEQILRDTPRRVAVTTFGLLPEAQALRVKDSGRMLIAQVGTAAAASAALLAGADAVIVQGTEAGGHLLGEQSTESLVRAVRARHPRACVVAAGGVATAADAARVRRAGADGVCCGTAFVATVESHAHPVFKDRVVAAAPADTVITAVFEIGWPGRRHRVLRNAVAADPDRFDRTFIGATTVGSVRHPVFRFSCAVPIATTSGRIEEMAMYAGLSCGGVDRITPAADVVAALAAGWEEES